MTLSVPVFIEQANINGAETSYPWNKQVFESLQKYRSGNLKSVLSQMSGHANLAFAAGVTEWVCRRLENATNAPRTLDYTEAVWAAMIDRRYLQKHIEEVDYTWNDPAKDVVMFASVRLVLAYYDCKNFDSDRVADTAQLVAAARHVLADKKPFDSWSKLALKRLVSVFPSSEGVGSAVPREALEVNRDFDRNNTTLYLNAFLERLSPSANEFLVDAAALESAEEFPGVPYRSVD